MRLAGSFTGRDIAPDGGLSGGVVIGEATGEQWIEEAKYALNWTRLFCHDFVDDQVHLQLFVLAYNLGNFLRRSALPREVKHWPCCLSTLQ